ncbi:MAG TPA: hypothetical protein VFV38_39720 [Ktedonobacteraceae bacterium]|nr:hypothetical protein [Ktedonobacteraceae bacterium]
MFSLASLRYSKLFDEQIDPKGEDQLHSEQLIAGWLFDQFARHTLGDHALHALDIVLQTFPPAVLEMVVTRPLYEEVKAYLLGWRKGLKDLAVPNEEEANQAGKDLTLLILHRIYPPYVETIQDKPHEEGMTALDLTISHLKALLDKDYVSGDEEIYETALEGTQLLKALGESSEYPHPYVELPFVPALLFPLENSETRSKIWVELAPSVYGFYITVHKHKPTSKDAEHYSRKTGMGGIHLDYYIAPQSQEQTPLTKKGTLRKRWKRPQEVLQMQLYDETVGPYDEPHWEIPAHYSQSWKDASIVLVRDVQRWKPAEEEDSDEQP